MKNVLWILVLVGILTLGFTSCSDDDGYSLGNRYLTFGTVEAVDGNTANGFNIRLDNGNWLLINNSAYFRGLEDNDRVFSITTLLGEYGSQEGYKMYIANLNEYSKILSKPPVLQSFINENEEHRQDSIGNDPIKVTDAWFGGKYLNVEFDIARQNGTNKVHFINLVADDVDPSGGRIDLYLRHNGYEDVPRPEQSGFSLRRSLVSFDITELIPAGAESMDIRLHWTEYTSTRWAETQNKEKTGTFTPYGKSDPAADKSQVNYETPDNALENNNSDNKLD